MANNLFSTLINRATTPLVKADDIDQPSLDRSPTKAKAMGFLGGAVEAASSPIDLLTAVIPFGRPARAAGKAVKSVSKGFPELGTLERMIHDTKTLPYGNMKPKVQPVNRWEAGSQPKAGGVLHEVLERAASKSGMGDVPTPGESSLMKQFLSYQRGR